MVLDIRHLRYGSLDQGLPVALDAAAMPAPAPPPEPAAALPGIEELLELATSADLGVRAGAVEQLRQIVPSDIGMDILWKVADGPDEPRRLVALQCWVTIVPGSVPGEDSGAPSSCWRPSGTPTPPPHWRGVCDNDRN